MTLIELDEWIKSMGIGDLSFADVQVCGRVVTTAHDQGRDLLPHIDALLFLALFARVFARGLWAASKILSAVCLPD